jgi:glycosyltransferase involved in cell wall biosynthesis
MSYDFRGARGKLQKLDVLAETRLLTRFSGIVAYTRYIGEDCAPQVPLLVMEGGVDPDETFTADRSHTENTQQRERIIFFSGSLSTTNGIELLLDAFSLLPDKSYRLWVFGRGRLEELVKSAAKLDNRIRYFGFVKEQREVLRHQRQSTVLVSLRPRADIINRYTFPSKLREYMLSGRPVISTAAPGIPDEYFEHMIVLQDETPKGLAQLLEEVCTRPSSELDRLGAQAHDFVLNQKNWSQQGKKVLDFIRNL